MLAHTSRNSSGFTLIEAIVAAALVATSLVLVAQLVAIGVRQSAVSTHALSALLAAQGQLEKLTTGGLAAGTGSESADFLLRWTIAPIDAVDPALRSIEVCAYRSHEIGARPDACVVTVRTEIP
jgi:type II secretory pathway pseudopilin PulG